MMVVVALEGVEVDCRVTTLLFVAAEDCNL
jgi:hypothetical protein